MSSTHQDLLITAWSRYLRTVDWRLHIEGIRPKPTDCGPVYELDNPLDRPDESFAIADMRAISVAGAHYHTGGESEVYFVLEGEGTTVVGGRPTPIRPGSVVVTPPDTAHFTISRGLVLAVVNTPPFNPANYVALTDSNPAVGYDHRQFTALTKL